MNLMPGSIEISNQNHQYKSKKKAAYLPKNISVTTDSLFFVLSRDLN